MGFSMRGVQIIKVQYEGIKKFVNNGVSRESPK
jgi:hypothetical protein